MPTTESLPTTLTLGAVHLNVSDLQRSVAWYERSLGLRVVDQASDRVALGDGDSAVVELHERPDARPATENEASLFHYCLLYPTRAELARALRRIRTTGTPVTNMNDRHTHEAVYLNDPDGTNVELAWDRPREQWPETPYGHPPVELDVDGLLATIANEETLAPSVGEGLRVGHLHFSVGDLDRAISFYRDVLGLDLKYYVDTSEKYKAGAFFSVGGYHHHMAANLAKGKNVGPLAQDALGVVHWTIELQDAGDVAAARDRIASAGAAVTDIEGGFIALDPWSIPVHVIS
ncbi:MAG: VOC family protein [Solirubrobacterales bacterium]|nr:VOC family protein [Solirubrobacterales bacterium]